MMDAGKAAASAATAGLPVFAPILRARGFGDADEWSRQIDVIEAQGWRLEFWAVDSNRPAAAHPVFRRAP